MPVFFLKNMHLKYITYLVTENSSKLVSFSEAKNDVSVYLFLFFKAC